MFTKLGNLFSQNSDDIAREKAKAVYYGLLTNGMTIIRDIIESSKEYYKSEEDENFKIKFPDEGDFKNFLGNEVGVIMCLISTREAFERFLKDKREKEIFTATLCHLFRNYLKISWDDFDLYLQIGEIFKTPKDIDISLMELFAARIIAFLRKDKEPWKDKELFKSDQKDNVEYRSLYWIIKYGAFPEAVLYGEIYTRIFETIMQILKLYAGKQADMKRVKELSKKVDEYMANKDKIA